MSNFAIETMFKKNESILTDYGYKPTDFKTITELMDTLRGLPEYVHPESEPDNNLHDGLTIKFQHFNKSNAIERCTDLEKADAVLKLVVDDKTYNVGVIDLLNISEAINGGITPVECTKVRTGIIHALLNGLNDKLEFKVELDVVENTTKGKSKVSQSTKNFLNSLRNK